MIKNFFSRDNEKKENPITKAAFLGGGATYNRKDKKNLAEEGYCYNVVVYRAIREITDGLANINIEIKQGAETLENSADHPAIKLLKNPNPTQSFNKFIKNIFVDYLITGEMFIARYPLNTSRPPSELWAANPLEMTVTPSRKGIPQSYIANKGQQNEKVFPVKGLNNKSDMFFMKMYNPLDYWRGLSPLEAAALSADTHNEGLKWNYSLLRNGARPSGIVTFDDDPSGETINRIREFFKKQIQGSSNAGGLPVLTGGANWQSVDNSPKDMDYLKTMKEVSKYVASAFGVPLPLVDNDAASYNNMEQAKERLWTDTIIPMLDEFLDEFGSWLLPAFGENLEFCADLDSIPALEGVRTRTFDRMVKAVEKGLLTIDEARKQIGHAPREGLADELFIGGNQVPLSMSGFSDIDESNKRFALDLQKNGYSEQEIKDILGDE